MVATGTGYTVNLTLPHGNLADPVACRYPGGLGGAGWDCARTSFTASLVTRSGVGELLDSWTVGDGAGPTAIDLRTAGVHGNATWPDEVLLALPVLGGLALFLIFRNTVRRRAVAAKR
jgi:hypothetical protein